MILVMADDDLSIAAANYLSKSCDSRDVQRYHPATVNLSKQSYKQLTIVDLTGDGSFQELWEPTAFADYLIKQGLPMQVEEINLLISDVRFLNSLATFSQKLTLALEKKGRDIKVHYVTNPNYQYNLIIPPSADSDEWFVYGIRDKGAADKLNIGCHSFFNFEKFNADMLRFKHLDLNALKELEGKKLIWKGKDIEAWLNHPQRTALPPYKKFGIQP